MRDYAYQKCNGSSHLKFYTSHCRQCHLFIQQMFVSKNVNNNAQGEKEKYKYKEKFKSKAKAMAKNTQNR